MFDVRRERFTSRLTRDNENKQHLKSLPTINRSVEHDDGLYLKESRRKEGKRRLENVWQREQKGCNAKNRSLGALAAIIQAVTLNSGKESADLAMDRLRDELGDDIAEHIGSYQQRLERATEIARELPDD
jgi:hypothetical protein